MKLLLCGGGSGNKTILANKKFNDLIDHSKPLLYIPLAMKSELYPSCLEWLTNEMKEVKFSHIEMAYSPDDLAKKELNKYCAIFIGGGNTYKLLSELKSNESFDHIKNYMLNDGIIYGGSAGAIIFGYDIDCCNYMDKNDIHLEDTKGYNCLQGFSLTAHYSNKSEEQTKQACDYLCNYTK